mgnify:CR=1 FL=1
MDDRKLVEQEQKDELTHYGTPRHSGRYPWGSGENPYQRSGNFVAHVTKLRKEGLSEVEIAKSMEMSTSQLRARMSIAKSEIRKEESAMAWKLKEKGYSNVAIGQRLGKNESSVRALLDPHLKARNDMTNDLAEQDRCQRTKVYRRRCRKRILFQYACEQYSNEDRNCPT